MELKKGFSIKVPAQELFDGKEGKKGGWAKGMVREVKKVGDSIFPLVALIDFFPEGSFSSGAEGVQKKFTVAFIDEEEFDCCAGIEATAFVREFREENPGRRVMVGFAEGKGNIKGVYLALWEDREKEG